MDPHCSDHSLIIVEIEEQYAPRYRPLKFFNHISNQPEFLGIISQVWTQQRHETGMKSI